MPADPVPDGGPLWLHRFGFLFPILIVLSVVVMVVPLPPLMMDVLLAGNITAAVMILLTAIQVRRPLEFSVFPALLLGTTLSRLVLNIASTRLILSRGALDGLDAAGGIIQSFGNFVAAGSLVIGLILFLILIAIQFLVITKGSSRISEVAARFALDGLPGRQLAIDADLNAGLIDKEEARRRREELSRQADFYGAMDGAGKFVRGDALAGMVITGVNIVGGLYIGIVQHGMSISDAARVFTTLTIGDGLVSQIPAFLIALGAGFLTTRTSADSDLSRDVTRQLVRHPAALFICGVFLLALSFTGLPKGPLLSLAGGCLFLGFALQKTPVTEATQNADAKPASSAPRPAPAKPDLFDKLHVEPLELELGIGLLKLTRAESGDLLARVNQMRQEIAQELGLILPGVRIRDNITLPRNEYRIRRRGVEIAQGTAWPDGLLALETSRTTRQIPGMDLGSGASLPKAKWIESKQAETARSYGYRVVESAAAVMIHFTEVIREHAAELLTRQQVHELLDRLKRKSPRLVDELVPDIVSTAQLHQVLSNLLRERVPIRDLETILQVMGDAAARSSDPQQLTEHVRQALAGSICQQYRDASRTLHAVGLDDALERAFAAACSWTERGLDVNISAAARDRLVGELERHAAELIAAGYPAVLVCSSRVRAGLQRIAAPTLPRLAVLSIHEIPRDTRLEFQSVLPARLLDAAAAGHRHTESTHPERMAA